MRSPRAQQPADHRLPQSEHETRSAQLPSKQGTSPEQTSVLEESIFKISGQLSTISRSQKYFRTRENRNFSTVNSTEKRIVNFSMIQIGLIVCMGALQVFVVRFFFQVSPLRSTRSATLVTHASSFLQSRAHARATFECFRGLCQTWARRRWRRGKEGTGWWHVSKYRAWVLDQSWVSRCDEVNEVVRCWGQPLGGASCFNSKPMMFKPPGLPFVMQFCTILTRGNDG